MMTEQTSLPAAICKKLDNVVDPIVSGCACMGPRDDEPVCPCAMRSVIKWRGRWVQLSVIGGEEPASDYLDGVVPEQRDNVFSDKSEFDLIVTGYTDKIAMIREVRSITGLGLFDAKKLVESLPKAIKEGISFDEALFLTRRLEEASGTVEMK